jgi:hypothetical protein
MAGIIFAKEEIYRNTTGKSSSSKWTFRISLFGRMYLNVLTKVIQKVSQAGKFLKWKPTLCANTFILDGFSPSTH